MQVTPKKIYVNFENKLLDKNLASNQLIDLIDNNEGNNTRVECIEKIREIGYKNLKIFHFLENLLLSDTNKAVRSSAFRAIRKNFPSKAITPVRHAFINENGPFLISLVKFLTQIDTGNNKDILIDKIKRLDENYLKISIENTKFEKMDLQELSEIICDYTLSKALDALYFHGHKIPFAYSGMD